MRRRNFLQALGLTGAAGVLYRAEKFRARPRLSEIPEWKPNTAYNQGDWIRLETAWVDDTGHKGAVCEVIQTGTSGWRLFPWPGWGKGSIYFSGTEFRAIVRDEYDILPGKPMAW